MSQHWCSHCRKYVGLRTLQRHRKLVVDHEAAGPDDLTDLAALRRSRPNPAEPRVASLAEDDQGMMWDESAPARAENDEEEEEDDVPPAGEDREDAEMLQGLLEEEVFDSGLAEELTEELLAEARRLIESVQHDMNTVNMSRFDVKYGLDESAHFTSGHVPCGKLFAVEQASQDGPGGEHVDLGSASREHQENVGVNVVARFLQARNSWTDQGVADYIASVRAGRPYIKVINLDKLLDQLDTPHWHEVNVCPACGTVRSTSDMRHLTIGSDGVRHCDYLELPGWKHKNNTACNAALEVRTTKRDLDGKETVVVRPAKIAKMQSFLAWIQFFVKRHSAADLMKAIHGWETRTAPGPGILSDIYDGRRWTCRNDLWKDPHFHWLGLGASFDFLQPFMDSKTASLKIKNTKIGLMHTIVLNLQREQRFQDRNVFVGFVMDGEPGGNINGFTRLWVNELRLLETEGIVCTTADSYKVPLKATLVQFTADSPARSKVLQVSHHSAHCGCPKCVLRAAVVEKTRKDGKPYKVADWSSPDRSDARSMATIIHALRAIQSAETKKMVETIVQTVTKGVRGTPFWNLATFDVFDDLAIDIMHAVPLGICKTVLAVYMKENLLDEAKLKQTETRIEAMNNQLPRRVLHSKLRSDLLSHLGGARAADVSLFVRVYSPYVLEGLLPAQEFAVWLKLQKFCEFVSSYVVHTVDVAYFDQLYRTFLRDFKRMHPAEVLPSNFHLCTHAADNILDFGPSYTSWACGYEVLMRRVKCLTYSDSGLGIVITAAKGLRAVSYLPDIAAALEDLDCKGAQAAIMDIVKSKRKRTSTRPSVCVARPPMYLQRVGINSKDGVDVMLRGVLQRWTMATVQTEWSAWLNTLVKSLRCSQYEIDTRATHPISIHAEAHGTPIGTVKAGSNVACTFNVGDDTVILQRYFGIVEHVVSVAVRSTALERNKYRHICEEPCRCPSTHMLLAVVPWFKFIMAHSKQPAILPDSKQQADKNLTCEYVVNKNDCYVNDVFVPLSRLEEEIAFVPSPVASNAMRVVRFNWLYLSGC
eukprot:m.180991 g.180991  ORF g.180991 m.180991 type:complete len:1044 (-) comp9992_c0_seq34:2722-5853(-)